jgi:predicted MFS family arabinose efflux permease
MYAAGLSTGFVVLAQDLHVEFGKLVNLISWVVFALGVANLFWMPTALCIGKRTVTLISMVTFLVGAIWSIKANSYNSLLGARILAAFGMLSFSSTKSKS